MVRNDPESICGQSVIYIDHEDFIEERERRETYVVDRTKSDPIFANLSTRDISYHGLMGVRETYEESSDLEDSNACFKDSQSSSLNKASLYAKSAGPCVDARFA